MMTETEYFYAWSYYALGAVLLVGCWWYATRRIPWLEVRYLLRVVVTVAIAMPWYTNSQQMEYYSPALLIAALETAFEGGDAFWRAGRPLLFTMSFFVALSALFFIGRRVYIWRRSH